MNHQVSSQNKLLLILTGIQFVYTLDLMIIMPLGPFFMKEWTIGAAEFGWLISSFAIAGGVSSFVSMFFIHKYHRFKVLRSVFVLFTIGLWLTAFAPNYWVLLLARIFTGIFGGLLGALILTEIGAQFDYAKRSQPVSFTTIALALASILGAPLGLWLANKYNWRAPFILISIVSSVVALGMYTYPIQEQIKGGKTRTVKVMVKSFFDDNNAFYGLLVTIALVLSQYGILIYLTPYMVNNLGVEENQLSFLYLVGGASIIATAPF